MVADLRKQFPRVKINVDGKANTVTINPLEDSDDANNDVKLVEEEFDKIVMANKTYTRVVDLPPNSNGMFIGKGGSNIKSLKESSGADFDIEGGGVLIRAKNDETVTKGEKAVMEWIVQYVGERAKRAGRSNTSRGNHSAN